MRVVDRRGRGSRARSAARRWASSAAACCEASRAAACSIGSARSSSISCRAVVAWVVASRACRQGWASSRDGCEVLVRGRTHSPEPRPAREVRDAPAWRRSQSSRPQLFATASSTRGSCSAWFMAGAAQAGSSAVRGSSAPHEVRTRTRPSTRALGCGGCSARAFLFRTVRWWPVLRSRLPRPARRRGRRPRPSRPARRAARRPRHAPAQHWLRPCA